MSSAGWIGWWRWVLWVTATAFAGGAVIGFLRGDLVVALAALMISGRCALAFMRLAQSADDDSGV